MYPTMTNDLGNRLDEAAAHSARCNDCKAGRACAIVRLSNWWADRKIADARRQEKRGAK